MKITQKTMVEGSAKRQAMVENNGGRPWGKATVLTNTGHLGVIRTFGLCPHWFDK